MQFELVEGLDLLDVINASDHGHLDEPYARLVFSQLVAGVSYIHQNELVHRDLKSENVMLEGDTLKVRAKHAWPRGARMLPQTPEGDDLVLN